MRREQTDFMRLLFSPEDLAQQVAASEAVRAELIRMAALGIEAMANARAFALANLLTSNPKEVIESFARYFKPQFDACLELHRQQSVLGSIFAEPKINWKPHPAVRRLIDQVRREMRSQEQPQELDTIA
jgi:hypothetical protein